MKVGFDLDGVVYDFTSSFDKFMRRKKLNLVNESSYNLGIRYGITEVEGFNKLHIFSRLRPFRWIDLNEIAKKEMIDLSKNNELYIITHREWATNGIEDTLERIKQDGLPVKESNIIFSKEKGEWANKLGIDIFYEDSAENALDIIDKSNSLVRLVDMPYNQIKHKKIERLKWD